MTNEQIVSFLSDPKVIAELKKLKTEEDIVSYLKGNGIEVTLKKAQTIKKALATLDSYKGKLTDEQLDDIVGGASVGKIMAGIVLGAAAVATIAGGGKFAYDVYSELDKDETLVGQFKGLVKDVSEEAKLKKGTPYEKVVRDTAKWIYENS